MNEVTRTERGWPAHFICADRCTFRRNTLLECGDRRVVVSTVGAYFPEWDSQMEEIGVDRYYETQAFEAAQDPECGCWLADVVEHVEFSSPWSISVPDMHGADEMHEAVVKEISEMLATKGDDMNESTQAQATALQKVARLAWGIQTEPLNELEASCLMDILASATNSSWVTIDFPSLAGDFKTAASMASWEYEHRDDGEIELEEDVATPG